MKRWVARGVLSVVMVSGKLGRIALWVNRFQRYADS